MIPDHRAPVVTHMVWYKVGAADEPKGVSGIAHFLEHLMFKSTDKIAVGEFSKIISKLGGQDNAFTGQDVTAYYQRIAKEQLETVMEMEADRMVNLRLTNEEVATERQVIIEERRSRIENNPGARLDEQMNAALYLSHPYGVPVIGWEHEMAKLSREDALRFYKRYYAPNNAILVVAGDVTVDEVKRLAEATYGKIPANPEVETRSRPQEPPHIAARRLTLKDPRAGNASFHRYYIVPSYVTAKPGEAEALDLLMKILADGSTSRLYRKLVVEDKVASTTGGDYSGYSLDFGRHLALRGFEQWQRPYAGRGRGRWRAGRHAQERRHAARARARQEVVARRLHLRKRQPGEPRPPLRLGRRHRPLARRRRRLAGGDRQSHDRRHQEGGRQLSRRAPFGDRLAAARAGRP